MYKLWCEWDINQEYFFFQSEEDAKEFAREAWYDMDIEDPFEDVWDDYVGVIELTLWIKDEEK